MKKLTDTLLFVLSLSMMLFFILHGHQLINHFFFGFPAFLNPSSHTTAIYLVFAGISGLFAILKHVRPNIYVLLAVGSVAAFVCSLIFIQLSPSFDIQEYILILYILGVSLFIIFFERYLSQKLSVDFWKLLFHSLVKLVQLFIILSVAWAAIFRFAVENGHQSTDVYMVKMIYASIVLLSSFVMISYWLLLPTWLNIVKLSHSHPNPSRAKIRRSRTGIRRR